MKKISTAILFIGLIQFLSGCSQAYRSNAYEIQQAQQRQAYNQAYQQSQRAQQARKTVNTTRKSSYTSQQSNNRPVVTQQPARSLMTKIAHSTIGKPY